jgi:PIN domain nuclease of toxin-antitoxin system
MKILLDTHTFIWYITDSPQLSKNAKQLIENENTEKLLSLASVWEMGIKHSIGKLNFSQPFMEFIKEQLVITNIGLLGIDFEHIEVITTLPLHHRDPFDRIIIAQAILEGIPVIGADGMFDAYGITRFW